MAGFEFQVTDSRGKTFRRTSRKHYTHAIVVHRKRGSVALWQRSEALAQKDADTWSKLGHVEAVEIIPVSAPRDPPGAGGRSRNRRASE